MTTEAQVQTQAATVVDVSDAKSATQKAPEPAEPAAKPTATGNEPAKATPAKPESATTSVRTVKTHKIESDDDDLPEDAELFELSPRALQSRIARATKKELKERFGTDNVDEIKQKLERADELQAKEEERVRAEMSEKERLEADLAVERRRAEAAELRLQKVEDAREYETMYKKVSSVAGKYVDPEYQDQAIELLQRDMRSNWRNADFDDEKGAYKRMDEFFKGLIERKPKLGKDYQANVEVVKTVPMQSGVGKASPNTDATAKPAAVPRVKDMTREQYSAWKKSRGLST